jgi:hypothetical protein
MSLEAAARRMRLVEHHGRRYVVRPPTLATVVIADGLFPKEIAAFANQAVDHPSMLGENDAARRGILQALLRDCSDGRAGEVLETCCSLCGGGPGDVLTATIDDAELAVVLGLAVLSLCDVPVCFKRAGWEKIGKLPIDVLEAEQPRGWYDPGEQQAEIGLVAIARRHGCAPHDVMQWPFEVVLMTNEASKVLDDPEARKELAETKSVPLETLAGFGIGYHREP